MKAQIKSLEELVQKEKKTLSDKVSAELDATLKQAVRERVETKKQLAQVQLEKEKLQKEYDDLFEMYNAMKDQEKQGNVVAQQSQDVIKELEKENQMMKEEKLAVSKANIEKTGQLEAATNTYEAIREAFLKLDDARYYLNQVMGPNGTMTEGERKIYL